MENNEGALSQKEKDAKFFMERLKCLRKDTNLQKKEFAHEVETSIRESRLTGYSVDKLNPKLRELEMNYGLRVPNCFTFTPFYASRCSQFYDVIYFYELMHGAENWVDPFIWHCILFAVDDNKDKNKVEENFRLLILHFCSGSQFTSPLYKGFNFMLALYDCFGLKKAYDLVSLADKSYLGGGRELIHDFMNMMKERYGVNNVLQMAMFENDRSLVKYIRDNYTIDSPGSIEFCYRMMDQTETITSWKKIIAGSDGNSDQIFPTDKDLIHSAAVSWDNYYEVFMIGDDDLKSRTSIFEDFQYFDNIHADDLESYLVDRIEGRQNKVEKEDPMHLDDTKLKFVQLCFLKRSGTLLTGPFVDEFQDDPFLCCQMLIKFPDSKLWEMDWHLKKVVKFPISSVVAFDLGLIKRRDQIGDFSGFVRDQLERELDRRERKEKWELLSRLKEESF